MPRTCACRGLFFLLYYSDLLSNAFHMSGHSKWANIKHKKAAVDAQRGKVFTKMAKLISVAVKAANGDVTHPAVITAIEKAKKYDVPKDNIERAIRKGSDKDAAAMEQVTYEGYGPGGVGLIIEAVTDNRNRTGQEVKHAFSKNGYSMGVPGSVSWGFARNRDGEWEPTAGTEIPISDNDSNALESLIEQFEELDDVTDVYVNAA